MVIDCKVHVWTQKFSLQIRFSMNFRDKNTLKSGTWTIWKYNKCIEGSLSCIWIFFMQFYVLSVDSWIYVGCSHILDGIASTYHCFTGCKFIFKPAMYSWWAVWMYSRIFYAKQKTKLFFISYEQNGEGLLCNFLTTCMCK